MGKRNSYIARKPCGCITMACVDNPEHKRETAKEVAKAIRLGETIDRVTSEYIRTTDWLCPYHRRKATTKEVMARLKEA